LVSLFLGVLGGGGGAEESIETPKFTLPAPKAYDLGLFRSEGQVKNISRDARGDVRSIQEAGTPAIPSVVVNVNAIDSRSFLDHSASIADAVREALLSSHSLNDILREG
jgi:hypothetical protein